MTVTRQIDANGDGTFESLVVSATTLNADDSSTVTTTEENGDGSVVIGQTAVTTSADGLSVTTMGYLEGRTRPIRRRPTSPSSMVMARRPKR